MLKRIERKWKFQQSIVRSKIKAKSIAKAKTVANYAANKTKSKRRKKAEQGYIDSKTQASNLMKSEIARRKSNKTDKK